MSAVLSVESILGLVGGFIVALEFGLDEFLLLFSGWFNAYGSGSLFSVGWNASSAILYLRRCLWYSTGVSGGLGFAFDFIWLNA